MLTLDKIAPQNACYALCQHLFPTGCFQRRRSLHDSVLHVPACHPHLAPYHPWCNRRNQAAVYLIQFGAEAQKRSAPNCVYENKPPLQQSCSAAAASFRLQVEEEFQGPCRSGQLHILRVLAAEQCVNLVLICRGI